jgi:hypothetical protein
LRQLLAAVLLVLHSGLDAQLNNNNNSGAPTACVIEQAGTLYVLWTGHLIMVHRALSRTA